ncbi:MAG TPA: pyruvate dehydrogenase complex dihydrolipoamide acetyltransferase [Myxococcales bacterium]|nr:pyruvate dehydrogenase complex dihydrolipoamide acetyltransferase [Myxococcales bacterium]
MATAIQMPALSPTMKEGKITRWLKKEGDKISSGEAIAECETDKSNLEIEAYEDGFLVAIAVKEGESAPVGAPIGFIGAKGEKVDVKAAAAPAPAPAPAPKPAEPSKPAAQVVPIRPAAPAAAPAPAPAPAAAVATGRVLASPLAKRMAHEQGLDLAALHGSGPAGRIVKRDVEAALANGAPAKAPAARAPIPAPVIGRQAPEAVPLSTMRKVIAQRMSEVKPGVPHFYLTVEVEMDAALKIREEAKALESKVSVNDILIKAAAVALRRSPKMNRTFQGDHVLQHHNVDVGMAVAIEDGLITPVILDADQKTLTQISTEARELAERARRRALKPQEYSGGTMAISNLGMYGIDSFVAVINPPHASILAVGAVADRPVAKDGQLAVRKMMSVTLSGDHRVIDGALGAEYLRELKGLLEHPMRLLF